MIKNENSYGATSSDWDHFDLILGLGEDLLPVVSNTLAKVSPDSKIKELGKTPSLYKRDGTVVGIAGWTSHQASDRDIARWAKHADYGICLQTRRVRALDIDVGDWAKATEIRAYVGDLLGFPLPRRERSNSGKCLLAFSLTGEMPKRKMVVEGGMIEFLATGQQFIAVGTHPSGVPYRWVGGLPFEFPELELEQFEALWAELAKRFAVGEVATGALSMRKKGENVKAEDPVAEHLHKHELVMGRDREGALIVECPWQSEHTTGSSGDGSTVWFPAGMNGYDRGHFKCLHGHCEGRGDSEFFTAVGYVEDVSVDFEVVAQKGVLPPPRPSYIRNDKTGEILVTMDNMVKGIGDAIECGMSIAYDSFRDEIVLSTDGEKNWEPFRDADYVRLRIALERVGFKPPGREITRDAVLLVAEKKRFDSAQLWLDQLTWDGVPRVETFFSTYFRTEDTEYTRSVGRYLWTALAGRVVEPGVKADMVPVAVGDQGTGKSSGVAAIVPDPMFFAEVSFGEKEDDLSRKMRGRLVAELGELRGLHTKELESIKAWVTKRFEDWTPKFREFNTTFPRRLVFFGTTNKQEFLADETGNRRWLPVKVGQVDVQAIERDRLQLWAEGRELFLTLGVDYQSAELLGAEVHGDHMMHDSWETVVREWLDEPDPLTNETLRSRNFLPTHEILVNALKFEPRLIKRFDEMRICNVMRALGYRKGRKMVSGQREWGFLPDLPNHCLT
jgi:hypothetical protein